MITATSTATNRIKRNLAQRGKGMGIRLAVKTTGCSGLAYLLEYVDSPTPDDVQYTSYDVAIFVDPKKSAQLIQPQFL